jgi:ribosome-binding factor A
MGRRINRINNLLKNELSWIIQQELDYVDKGFVTLTSVKTSPDLKYAKVYVSFMNEGDNKQALKALKETSPKIKKFLAQRTKLRYIPELAFFEDNSLTEINRMEELFEKIKNDSTKEKTDEHNENS